MNQNKKKKHSKKVKIDTVIRELNESYELAKDLSTSVTVLGSARFNEDNKYYKRARELGFKLAEEGVNIISGGGGGIMEASNRGAYESGKSESIGFNIFLPNEQTLNPYTHKNFEFKYFYSRKYMLFNFSEAIVVFPGGFGTLDELLEILTLLQTEKLDFIKIYLYDNDFWKPILESFEKSLLKNETISQKDMERFRLTDDLDWIVCHIMKDLKEDN